MSRISWMVDYINADAVYQAQNSHRWFAVTVISINKLNEDLLVYTQAFGGPRKIGIDYASFCTHKILLKMPTTTANRATSGRSGKLLSDVWRTITKLLQTIFCGNRGNVWGADSGLQEKSQQSNQNFQQLQRKWPALVCSANDCLKFYWKLLHCQNSKYHNTRDEKLAPVARKGRFDRNFYIWSWFLGPAGTNYETKELNHSPLFVNIVTGNFTLCTTSAFN